MKKVSIIITCYNKGKYVKETVESALNQTYQNIEIVCIDDASTDDSYEILKSFVDKYKNIVLLHNEENKGVIYSRNTAIDAAGGEYILPLDADDTIEPTYVEEAAKILDENSDVGIVYSKADFFGAKNKIWELAKYDINKILYGNCIFNSALYRKSDFLKIGKYKEYMNMGWEDYDLWLSFIENGLKPYRIEKVLFHYRQINETTVSDSAKAKLKDLRRTIVKNHLNLYLDNEDFNERIWTDIESLQIKYKKYKRLFNLFLTISIVMIVVLILLIFII